MCIHGVVYIYGTFVCSVWNAYGNYGIKGVYIIGVDGVSAQCM